MSAAIYVGKTIHERFQPVQRSFGYRLFWIGIDLPLQGAPVSGSWLLGVDRPGVLSIRTRGGHGQSGRSRVQALLADEGMNTQGWGIVMMTMPRVLGYAFNPVIFYVCREGSELKALVCEVRNTFGEVHHYVAAAGPPAGKWATFSFPKQFYVSPFLEDAGRYQLRVSCYEGRYEIDIALMQHDQLVFRADLRGDGAPLTTGRLCMAMLRLPLSVTLVMIRIHWQALVLRLRLGIRPHHKPAPAHPRTLPASRPSVWHWFRRKLISVASRRTSCKEK